MQASDTYSVGYKLAHHNNINPPWGSGENVCFNAGNIMKIIILEY